MKSYRNPRQRLIESMNRDLEKLLTIKNIVESNSEDDVQDLFMDTALDMGVEYTQEFVNELIQISVIEWRAVAQAIGRVRRSETIFFSGEQGQVFYESHKYYDNSLEYRLPFQDTLLCFTPPVTMPLPATYHKYISEVHLSHLILTQLEVKDTPNGDFVKQPGLYAGIEHSRGFDLMPGDLFNLVTGVFPGEKGWYETLAWKSTGHDEFPISIVGGHATSEPTAWPELKNLAIACIGYINCENIYLYKEGEVPEAVNAKRERKGKARLEPYYVCRIRGITYDGPVNKGTGVEHGFRYDVRGHFRRLDTGKVTWVRPHQRGLKHELYIPKVYSVDRRLEEIAGDFS